MILKTKGTAGASSGLAGAPTIYLYHVAKNTQYPRRPPFHLPKTSKPIHPKGSVIIRVMKYLGALLAIYLLFGAFAAQAQTSLDAFGDFSDLTSLEGINFDNVTTQAPADTSPTITIGPNFPQPGEAYTATFNDYSAGSFGSNITWLVDGEAVPNSTNRREIELTAPPAGQSQTVSLILNRANGSTDRSDLVVQPLYVDIIIEPQTHTPDFYLGRSLPSPGSLVNATAIISDGEVAPADLVYSWRVNQEVIGLGPIRGGQSVSFETSRDDELIVTVEVSRPNGTKVGGNSILIPSVNPYLRFYESNPLFGIKNRPASDPLSFVGNSVTLRATPYHLDSRVFNDPSLIEWSLGNNTLPNQTANPYEITLETTGAGGRSSLNFHVRDIDYVLQGARDSIDISL